ncbi:MAG: DnaJ domain-containing protein [Phycisphaerales bacterium]|nr:DnaJ domain-containing protein [Phycisphaerales bacterium]
MSEKDLYSILGVSHTASQDEIKKAYRALARKLHPDVNKAPNAATEFGKVQEAYDVLSDEKKRRYYDQFGVAPGSAASEAGSAGSQGPWGAGGGMGGGGGRGSNVRVEGLDLDPEEIGSMFESFFGRGGNDPFARGPFPGGRAGTRAGSQAGHRTARAVEPLEHELFVSFMTAALGGKEDVRIVVDDKPRTIEVNIPAGVREGQQLRVRKGAGERDVVITVKVGEHPTFRRGEGNDLLVDLALNFGEAALGATVPVPTLDGAVELTVPPATSSASKLRLRGKGIKPASGNAGDLYVVIKIIAPKPATLSAAEVATLRAIGAKQGDVRQ